eukprot:15002800-Alexandrium_andersonii.AAC.1
MHTRVHPCTRAGTCAHACTGAWAPDSVAARGACLSARVRAPVLVRALAQQKRQGQAHTQG